MTKEKLNKFGNTADKVITKICRLVSYLVPVILIGLVLLMVLDILLRTFFNKPIDGSVEIVQVMIATAGFLSIPLCTVLNRNIRVDMLVTKLPKRAGAAVEVITSLLSLFIVPLISWQTFLRAEILQAGGDKTMILGIPLFPFYLVIAVAFFLLFFAQLSVTIKYIVQVVKGS